MEINIEIIQPKIIDTYGKRSSTFDPNKYFKIMFNPIETETKNYFFQTRYSQRTSNTLKKDNPARYR